MNNRLKKILLELYKSPKGKKDFSTLYKVSDRTISDDMAKYNEEVKNEDIIYDINLKKYRFNTLLPKKIPSYTLLKYLQSNINDTILNDDYNDIVESINTDDVAVIDTDRLSPLLQNIIRVQVSFVINAILEIEYFGLKQKLETKWIRPRTLINTGVSYYLNAIYDEKNSSNQGEERSFSLKGIQSMKIFEIEDKEILHLDGEGNAWGLFNKNKYITIKLVNEAAFFFKREKIANKKPFEFISEEPDGSVLINMYYNDEQEIVQIMQRWMPYITILKESDLSERIYSIIRNNFVSLTINKEIGR